MDPVSSTLAIFFSLVKGRFFKSQETNSHSLSSDGITDLQVFFVVFFFLRQTSFLFSHLFLFLKNFSLNINKVIDAMFGFVSFKRWEN